MKTQRSSPVKSYTLAAIIISSLFLVQTLSAQDATALYEEGVKLKNEKSIKEAVEKFKQAIAIKPDYTEALYESGWCMNDLKDYQGAMTNLRKARKSWSNIPKVHFELGYAFEKTGFTDSAVQCYNECIRLKPDYSSAHKQLGTILYVREDYKKALEEFAQYELAAKDEIKDYLFWYRKGFMLNTLPDYPNAVIALKKSLEYKTDYINTYLELGFACSKQKFDDDAIYYYKKAMEVDPQSHIPYNGIGEVYRDNKKDYNESMVWYRKALAINATERKASFGMGYCLNSLGKYDEAAGYLRTAIASEATYTAAYVELGYTLYMLAKYTEALQNLDKARSLNPKNENARYYAGLVHIKQANKTMAQKMADELKALNSKLAAGLQSKVDAM